MGDLSFADFFAAASAIQWKITANPLPSVVVGERQSGMNLPAQKTILITANLPPEAHNSLAQFELHELFGALGYNDLRYDLTTAMVALGNAQTAAQAQRLAALYGKRYFTPAMKVALRDDGGSAVGSGGDIRLVAVKQAVLEEVLRGGKEIGSSIDSAFVREFPSVNFDPLPGVAAHPVLAYKYILAKGAQPYRERYSVYVPVSRLGAGDPDPALVREIAAKMLAIFPARVGGATRTITPPGCPAGKTITFPDTSDEDVLHIQAVRGALLLGCIDYDGLQDYETRPNVPGGLPPAREAGSYLFHCEYDTNGQPGETYDPAVKAGMGLTDSTEVGLDGGTVDGYLYVDAQGRILATRVTFRDAADHEQLGPITRATDSAHGAATLTVNGTVVRYACEARR